jgi:hypothetical protein
MIHVEKIDLLDVKSNDKIKYNTNNHWVDNVKPIDYSQINELTETKKWINLFRKIYFVVNLDFADLFMLKNMYNVCLIKNSIPDLYQEEIEYLIKKYSYVDDYLKYNGGHFVRCENVSLKYGKHGCIPYSSFKEILESILTSPVGHSPLYEYLKELRLYLIPWVTIDKFKEFRVFVYKQKITAISQQHLYESNLLLSNLKESELKILINSWIDIITSYFDSNIKNKISVLSNYSYDFAILEDNKPYFIEINPFGKEYSSGSSLFGWIIDEQKLYNTDGDIYFRYCV